MRSKFNRDNTPCIFIVKVICLLLLKKTSGAIIVRQMLPVFEMIYFIMLSSISIALPALPLESKL